MKYNIKKNWLSAFELITTRPIVALPFIIIGFLEALALEFIYFFPRKPLLLIAGPIIKKFFGEGYLHYPANLIILPKQFFYVQVVIYVLLWGFLAGISVNIIKNIRTNLPVKSKAVIKNAVSRYLSFLLYGITVIALIILIQQAGTAVFFKFMNLIARRIPQIMIKLIPVELSLLLFIANIFMQVFVLLAVPIIALYKKSFLKAILRSIYLGGRNFSTIFKLIFLPFLLYLPVSLLRSIMPQLADKTIPEISILVTVLGIIMGVAVDCFVTICAVQFLLDKEAI